MINFNCISACYISKLAMTVIIFLVVNNLWQKVSVYKNQIDSPQCLLRVRKYLILHTALRVLSPCNGFPIIHNFCRYRNKLTASNFLLPLEFIKYCLTKYKIIDLTECPSGSRLLFKNSIF